MKNFLKYLIPCVLGFLIGIIVWEKEKKIDPPVIINTTQSIDSLENIIKEREIQIDSLILDIEKLKDSVIIIEKTTIQTIEVIKELPIDSNLILLRNNLECLEEDSLPRLEERLEDTIVVLSEKNLIDINCTYSKYSGILQENIILGEIIQKDSISMEYQNLIINDYNLKTEYLNNNIKEIQNQLKKTERTKNAWMIGGIAVTGSFLIYLFLQK